MTLKHRLLTSGSFGGMTANERRLGRYIRDGEGHPAPAAPAAPAAAEEPADAGFTVEPAGESGPNDFKVTDFNSGTVDPATPEPEQVEGQDPPPADDKGSSAQERIDEVTAARREAERQAAEATRAREAAEARAAEAEALLEALRNPKKEGTDEAAQKAGQKPNPADFEFGEADSGYIEALADWKVDQRLAERDAQQAQSEAAKTTKAEIEALDAKWEQGVSAEDVTTRYPDFAEKVTEGAKNDSWKCSVVGAILIKSSPVGHDVAYHLASNPEESERIAKLDVPDQFLEIGRLEGRFLYERDNRGTGTPKPKLASTAPTPPDHKSRGAGGKFDTSERSMYRKMLSEF